MTTRARRVGFGAALATGLSLLGLSIGGMASLDADLRAAAQERPGGERITVVDHGVGKCWRQKQQRSTTSGREI